MSEITIFHNPRCSKSRQALALLNDKTDQDTSIHIVEYLKQAPSYQTYLSIFEKTGLPSAYEMIRPKEPEFKEAQLTKSSSNEEILNALVSFPKLLERPIVIKGDRAIIARPPELLKAIL